MSDDDFELTLRKSGAVEDDLDLGLTKTAALRVELSWKSKDPRNPVDVDAHGYGLKRLFPSKQHMLTTFLVQKPDLPHLPVAPNADGSFSIIHPSGYMVHGGDDLDGSRARQGINELITIFGSKIPSSGGELEIDEIMILIATFVEGVEFVNGVSVGVPLPTFSQLTDAKVVVKGPDGRVVKTIVLADEFGPYNGVGIGSVKPVGSTWKFAPSGEGFNGSINHFTQAIRAAAQAKKVQDEASARLRSGH